MVPPRRNGPILHPYEQILRIKPIAMTYHIVFKDGRWTVNGKRYEDLNHDEKIFMDDFFREVKINHNNGNNGSLSSTHN